MSKYFEYGLNRVLISTHKEGSHFLVNDCVADYEAFQDIEINVENIIRVEVKGGFERGVILMMYSQDGKSRGVYLLRTTAPKIKKPEDDNYLELVKITSITLMLLVLFIRI